jgi:phosphatidylinositol 4-kinase A
LPFEASTPTATQTGIEVWTWIIAEKPELEVAIMSEILAAWSETIKHQKGIFSPTLKYVKVRIKTLLH